MAAALPLPGLPEPTTPDRVTCHGAREKQSRFSCVKREPSVGSRWVSSSAADALGPQGIGEPVGSVAYGTEDVAEVVVPGGEAMHERFDGVGGYRARGLGRCPGHAGL